MRHCRTCTCPPVKRKAIAKVSRKVSTRAVDGVVKFGNGQELDKTQAAKDRRRANVWWRDDCACQQRIYANGEAIVGEFGAGRAMICGKELALSLVHIHHIRKRSLRGGDQDSNRVTLCPEHHRLNHPGPQWSKK